MVNKVAGTLASNTTVAPAVLVAIVFCINTLIVKLYIHTYICPFPLRMPLMKQWKLIHFITSWSLRSHLLNIVCDEIGSRHEVFLLHAMIWLRYMSCKLSSTAAFFLSFFFFLTWKNDWKIRCSYSDLTSIWRILSEKWTKGTCYCKKTRSWYLLPWYH